MTNIFDKVLRFSKGSKKVLLPEEKITYGEFYNLSHLYFNFLKKNVKSKQVVCISSEYSVHYLALIFSCYLNRNVINIINMKASDTEKKFQILDSRSSAIFLSLKNKNFHREKNNKVGNFLFKRTRKSFFFKNNDTRFLIYTSGTTNKPKGVMISDNAISNNVEAINKDLNFDAKDRFLIFSPPNYAMGISQILSALCAKGEIFFYNKGLKFPNELKEMIIKHKISIINLSISAFKILENYISSKKILTAKIVMSGGMHYGYDEFIKLKKIFPKAKLINFYGCSENSPRISHCRLNKNLLYKGYFPVGKILKGVKLKIKYNNKKKNNKEGKIFISGSSLMNGYFGFDSKKKFSNNWFETGDLGFFRKGNLYLSGREDNVFSVGHEKLCPEEIEAILKKKFNFKEIVVAKMKDKILNNRSRYFIEKGKKEISKKKIMTYVQKNFSTFKFPKEIIFVKKIPRTKYGKINRKKLN